MVEVFSAKSDTDSMARSSGVFCFFVESCKTKSISFSNNCSSILDDSFSEANKPQRLLMKRFKSILLSGCSEVWKVRSMWRRQFVNTMYSSLEKIVDIVFFIFFFLSCGVLSLFSDLASKKKIYLYVNITR